MGSSGSRTVIPFVRSVNLLLSSFQETSSLPYWDVIGFFIREAHIIHQRKDLFQKDLFILWRQAKKSSPQVAWRPPTPYRNEGIGCPVSF